MELLRLLSTASPSDFQAWRKLVDHVGATELATWLSPPALVAATLADTELLCATLHSLYTAGGAPTTNAPILAAFPEAAALAAQMAAQVEHDAGTTQPLLEHIATRVLGAKLVGLEKRDHATFGPGLSSTAFTRLADICTRVIEAGLGPVLRVAMMHLDIAKTADPAMRAAWSARGIPLEVHNEASAAILRAYDRPAGWSMAPVLGELALALIEAHGLAGQHVRGEGPMLVFAPLVARLRELSDQLWPALGTGPLAPFEMVALALDALHVIDACDTSAVREGLLDDALLAKLAKVRAQLGNVCRDPEWQDPTISLAALSPPPDRAALATRLRSLRAGRQHAGEPAEAVTAAVAAIGDTELAALAPALATCQLWYCESATSGLSPAAQLGVLAAAVGAARSLGVDVSRPWHAMLKPLVARLHGDSPAVRYRLRLVEAALAATPLRQLVTGSAHLGPLGALSSRLAHPTDADAIVIDYADSDESAALITLLGVYETRSQVSYHTMLKALCDLYGLRKDEFDRVANEANYLLTMNAARSDKQRMLDYVKPGTIVEIGPGGGVVLDLLEERYADSKIVGVDLSREVIGALEGRAKSHGRAWTVALGAAEDLADIVPAADTVVFCSILHEVYSYTEPKFALASVEAVIKSAFGVLRPGGRIVIRDGVMPAPGTRRIKMLSPDVKATLELYCAQFAGRAVTYTELAPDRVEMTTPDAMEFLYTYTWGPASFPYEVRELYGIMTYDDYVAALLRWCGPAARVVPNELGSYLQPGYRENLRTKIELTDERDQPVELPDSNCLIVIEKT
ncbi:MAG TPA: methyltransferase [Kofleriaceae bacterium]